MGTLTRVIGMLCVEPLVLLVGWLLYAQVAPLASFVFAAGVSGIGLLVLWRQSDWAQRVGLWVLVSGLTLLVVNAVVLL